MGLAQTCIGHQNVICRRVYRYQAGSFHIQRRQQTNVAQQTELKRAQCQLQRVAVFAGDELHRGGVRIKQRRVRVVSGQQTHQQFVEVVARQQRVARWHHMAALPLRAFEIANFSVSTKRHMQQLQRQQDRSKAGTGFLGSARHQRDAPVLAREHIQNQAGLAPVIAVQHIGRLVADALGGHRQRARRKIGNPCPC